MSTFHERTHLHLNPLCRIIQSDDESSGETPIRQGGLENTTLP
jgi:hypothetical protein